MSRSVGLAHIIRQDDGTSVGVWGVFTVKSAFQPLFSLEQGRARIAAFEGLVRPFRGDEALSPYSFFSLVSPVDRFHVETLTRTLHLLNAGACLDPATMLFVNFNPALFTDRAVVEVALRDMRLVLHEAGIDPRRIVCEVTEQTSASGDTLDDFVYALRQHGFHIAVDDYGSEDSDINRIRALKPDIVKFDARWITGLMESGAGFALLSEMVSTFAAQGIRTVFEGIEESWQLELAERAGASLVQGYVLARPEIAPTSFAMFKRRAAGSAPAVQAEPAAAPTLPAPKPRPQPAAQQRAFGRRMARQ